MFTHIIILLKDKFERKIKKKNEYRIFLIEIRS